MSTRSRLALAVLIGVALPHPLLAQDVPDNQELARRIDRLEAELESFQIGEAALAAESRYGLGPAASKVYAASGVSIGGYGEMLYQRSSDAATAATWDFYRAILYLGYHFDENWVFNSEIEIEHIDQVALEMAYLDRLVTEGFNVRAGHILVPMGLINEMHEPTTFWSASRPAVERFVLPSTWHENGVGVFGAAGDFAYRSYILDGFDAATLGATLGTSGFRKARQAGSQATAENLAWVGRVDWSGLPGAVLGASVYRGDANQSTTGAGPDFATTIFEFHGQYDWEALRLRGLYASGEMDGATTLGNPGDEVEGWYLEAGWDVWAGGESALTPFVRHEILDLAADAPGDRATTIWTLGCAWQPRQQLVFKIDLQDHDAPGAAADAKVLEIAAGYVF